MGAVLGGLLRGVGSYMVDEARARREAALQALREDRADQRAAATDARRHEYQLTETSHSAAVQGKEQRATLEVSAGYQADERRAARESQRALQEDEQAHERSMEGIRHQYRISEAQETEARTAAREARERGEVVARWEINASGQMVGYNARGEEVTRTETEFEAPSQRNSRSRRQGGGQRPAARPATVREAPARIVDVRTAEEARNLPPGQRFRTPDGIVRVRQ